MNNTIYTSTYISQLYSIFQIRIIMSRQDKNSHANDNAEKIKLFISQVNEPIPDITHQQTDIYSEFKFFFNDDQLLMYTRKKQTNVEDEDFMSILHNPIFQQKINKNYEQWKQLHRKAELNKQQDSLKQDRFANFIAFIDFWLTKMEDLEDDVFFVNYRPYNQLIAESIQCCLQECIQQVKFNLCGRTRIQLPKNIIANQQENLAIKEKQKEKNKLDKQKRLQQYFKQFSIDKQTVASLHTFQQLKVAYSTVNLSQWVRFSKQFIHIKMIENSGKVKVKQINVTVRKLKSIFDQVSKNNRGINYQQFKIAIHTLFIILFGSYDPNLEEDMIKFEQWIKIENHQDFREQMKKFGVYIPQNETTMPKLKNTLKIQSKYLSYKKNQLAPISNENKTFGLLKLSKLDENSNIGSKLPITHNLSNFKAEEITNVKSIAKTKRTKQNQEKKWDLQEILDGEEDQFLNCYQNKASIGIIKRIDERIQKVVSCSTRHRML